MNRLIHCAFVLVLVIIFSVCRSSWAQTEHALKKPGIVSQKPSSGRFVKIDGGYMVPYQQAIPGSEHSIWMEPIPGIEEVNHSAEASFSTGKPFWMARYETSHAEYLPYMKLYYAFREFRWQKLRPITPENELDAVTAPTVIYDPDFAFEYGVEPQHPVGTMTLFCARQYTKWLSKLTDMEFRLPTEKEWEHACSAGATTRFHFGDDANKLDQYGWFGKDLEVPGYRKVGLLKPNRWGLYDMHGNMAEWVIRPGVTDNESQVLKGGCWEFPPEKCQVRSVLRFDQEAFQSDDPMIPQSSWWLASYESRWVGFRIIRPLEPMTTAEKSFAWEPFSKTESENVSEHLEEGRGARGIVDPTLPIAIGKLPKRRD